MGVPPVRREILTGLSGVEFRACYSRRLAATIDGVPVNVIANKGAAGRHKDLNGLEQLGG